MTAQDKESIEEFLNFQFTDTRRPQPERTRQWVVSADTIYALDHVKGMEPGPDRKGIESIKANLKQLPKEVAAQMEIVLQRYELMGDMMDASREFTVSLQKALALIPASDWARRLRPMPTGSVIPNRSVMVGDSKDGGHYYDITEGRFLTKEEAKEAR